MFRKGIPGVLVALTAGSALATVLGVVSSSSNHSTPAQKGREANQRTNYDPYYRAAPPPLEKAAKVERQPLVITGNLPDWMNSKTGAVLYPMHKANEVGLLEYMGAGSRLGLPRGLARAMSDGNLFDAAAYLGVVGSGLAYAYTAPQADSLAGPNNYAGYETARRYTAAPVSVPGRGQRVASVGPATDTGQPTPSTNADIPAPSAMGVASVAAIFGLRRRRN